MYLCTCVQLFKPWYKYGGQRTLVGSYMFPCGSQDPRSASSAGSKCFYPLRHLFGQYRFFFFVLCLWLHVAINLFDHFFLDCFGREEGHRGSHPEPCTWQASESHLPPRLRMCHKTNRAATLQKKQKVDEQTVLGGSHDQAGDVLGQAFWPL